MYTSKIIRKIINKPDTKTTSEADIYILPSKICKNVCWCDFLIPKKAFVEIQDYDSLILTVCQPV